MMKTTLLIPVDSEKWDMGVADLLEAYRPLFEQLGKRLQIADKMTELLGGRQRINRQMIEKWFAHKRRIMPSSILLVTFLTACQILDWQEDERKSEETIERS